MGENNLQQVVFELEVSNKELEEKREKAIKENQEIKAELERITVQAEIRLEETERQKKLLENNKSLLIEKQLKIEEIEKSRKYLEGKEKTSSENVNELKKYLKEYEELLIQLKKDKDEVMRTLKHKESELEFLQDQFSSVKTECTSLKSALSSTSVSKPSISDIEMESLNAQVLNYSEALKKSKSENEEILEANKQLLADKEIIDNKLKNIIDDYQSSLNRIYELENILKESAEVKIKYSKALEEINDLSTVLESFRKDVTDSKYSEEKINYQEKYIKNKELKKKYIQELMSANNRIEDFMKEIEKLTKKNNESEELLKAVKNDELEAYTKFKSSEEEWDRIKSEIIHTSSQQAREIEILQNRIKTQENFFEKELQSTQLSLESARDEIKNHEFQAEMYKAECEKLKDLERQLSEGIPEEYDTLKELVENMSLKSDENLKDFQAKLDKILAEKEKLRKKLQKTEADLQQASEECQQLHKLKYENRKEETISFGSLESSSRSIQDSLIIEGISPSIIFHNPLLERISKLRKEPPMTYSTVWKTLELLMQEKLKADKIDIEIGRAPMNTADYMFEFMYKQYGLKALGLKQLKALIVSLEEMYKVSHPYAVFFCRVLGIFHPRPIPIRVSAYIFIIQEQFNLLTKKLKQKPESFPEIYEIMQFGGEVSIADLIDLIKKVFRNNRQSGERIIENLYKDQPDKLELSILKICAALNSLGKTEEDIFNLLPHTAGNLDYQEFIDNIREAFDIWITQEEAEMICALLDGDETGIINIESWRKKIRFNEFCTKIYAKPAMVTKADFFNSLVCEYEYEALEDYHELRKIIKGNMLTPDVASQYLIKIDSSLTIDSQERIYKEALVHDGGHGKEVSCEALCIVILKHNIGGYGKGLFQPELLQEALR